MKEIEEFSTYSYCTILRRPRGSKKTTMLLMTSAVMDYPIIVATHQEAEYISQKAKENQMAIPSPLTIGTLLPNTHRRTATKVLVDNYDQVYTFLLEATLKDAFDSLGSDWQWQTYIDNMSPLDYLYEHLVSQGYEPVAVTSSYTIEEIKDQAYKIIQRYKSNLKGGFDRVY